MVMILHIIIMNNIAAQHIASHLVFSALLVCLASTVARYEPVESASSALEPLASPVFGLAHHQTGPSLCPLVANCHCKWTNGKQGAFCERRGLATIPAQLPQDTQVLDFSGNGLSQLSKDLFREKHLTNLQRLHLAECKISFIADEAFAQLTNLVELDLANNNLLSVPSKSFEPFTHSLRKLSLAHNPIQTIEPKTFSSLKHLNTLDLSNCQLSQLKPSAFFGLTSLNDLKLAENRLTQLPMNVMNDLRDYSMLDLYGNPWHCDCELRQSIDWMAWHHVQQALAPTCATPQRHKDIRWQNVKPEELICPPVVINRQNDLVVGAGSNVSLHCSAKGSSPLTFVWFQDERNLTTGRANVTEPPSSTKLLEEKRYEIAEEIGIPGQPNVTTSILYLYSLKITDTSLFLCWVENTAGYMIANFSLTVNDSPPSAQVSPMDAQAGETSNLLQSIGLSQSETRLGIVSIGFVIVLAAAIILLLVIKHSTNRSTKSSQTSDDDLKSSKANSKVAAIGTISGSSKYNNGGHSRSMLADSEDIDDDDDDDIDGRSSSGSSSCISKTQPKVVASGVSDAIIEHMRHGIISMEYHSLSPAYEFNTLKKNNKNTVSKANNNQQQQQHSLPYLDTSHHQPMHHFHGASNASSAPYYGNGSPMATTTSDLSPGSGSVNTNFAPHNQGQQPQHHQQQLNITNCDPQPHHLNDMAPATNTATSYTDDYHQGGGYNHDPSHNMMPTMYYETTVDPSTLHHYHPHPLQQQHQHHHNMNHPPNGHMYPVRPPMGGPVVGMTPSTTVMTHIPQQQQQGDHLVVQSMMQGRLMPNQRLRSDDEFHHIL